MYHISDTIVAISSISGASARGIIRLSGPLALDCASTIFTPKTNLPWPPKSWTANPGRCMLNREHDITCPATLIYFASPRSYTTEPMAELHLPGSPALLDMVLQALLNTDARLANPGEFTARAFFNGRIDLTEAEAVAAVINARSDGQLRAAEKLLDGQLHQQCHTIANTLADILALVEADIDFSEEEIEFASYQKIKTQVGHAHMQLQQLLKDSITWEELNHLPRVVLAGNANAGKSSLVNCLLGLPRSVISAIAGTTRDMLTAPLHLAHGECLLVDTAGLGDIDDPLITQTTEASTRAILSADLLIWVFDCTADSLKTVTADLIRLNYPSNILFLANKTDLLLEGDFEKVKTKIMSHIQTQFNSTAQVLFTSALTADNLDQLKAAIDTKLRHDLASETASQQLALTVRQRQALINAEACMQQALQLLSEDEIMELELIALELRDALDHLGQVSGAIVAEDVLTRIFSQFCIGK